MNFVLLVKLPRPIVAIFIDILVDWHWSLVRKTHELPNEAVAQYKVHTGVHAYNSASVDVAFVQDWKTKML